MEAGVALKNLKRMKGRPPAWYSLYGGPSSLAELAEHLGHLDEYDVLYREWSGPIHASDLGRQVITGRGTIGFRELRAPEEFRWWAECPDANVGIVTGATSGVFALDEDPRHGGHVSLAALEREHGHLPVTVQSRTGGGGRHLLFACPRTATPIRNRVNLARGLDVRADGGYIVAPPSNGDRYAWVIPPDAAPLAELPRWLLELVLDGGDGDGAGATPRGRWTAELPPDWDERLARDPILAGYWNKARALRGPDDSMSAYALAIANRLVREYRESDEQILGALDAFYRRHDRTKAWEALVLTLRKARGAPSDRDDATDGDGREREADRDPRDRAGGAMDKNGQGDGSGGTSGDESSSPSLADLLGAVEALLRRYVAFQFEAQAVAVAIWVGHAHAINAVDVTPYLSVTSAEKRSGKSRLLEVLARLVPRAWSVVLPTEAVVFRKIERDRPTLLIDEVDTVFNGRADVEGLRALLNAGNRREAVVSRCQGKAQKLVDFRVFCPKVLAGIGTLPDTVADRSIPIRLARKRPTERVARLRVRDVEAEAAPLNAGLAQWADEAIGMLRAAEPEVPSALNDRAAVGWEPLMAIADLAGGEWPERARAAALQLHGKEFDEATDGIALLGAIRELFRERQVDRILTVDLLDALVARETEPWAVWWGPALGRDETQGPAARLARLLKPFGIIPNTIRIGERRAKGYERAAFAEAFERYLSPEEDA
jgi:hypothetical protein